MACPWRIRHKLMLGLGLVVGIMAVLLAGAVKGLRSFNATLKSIDSKLAELSKADEFRAVVGDLHKASDPKKLDWTEELESLERNARHAQAVLAAYETQLQHTIDAHRDPNEGFNEKGLISELRKHFGQLDQAVQEAKRFRASGSEGSLSLLQLMPALSKVIADLRREAGQLRDVLNDELGGRIDEGKRHYRTSMIVVIAAGAIGVLLLVSLTRFTYRWVFYPVRELERGVGRLAQGDFDHAIEIHSGDEMQDLAEAFNDMTGRLREMYRDLAQQVNDRSRQLVRSERLASVGFLAAGVAHEINNPLASIAFCSEALESRLADALARVEKPADAETVTKYLRMIQQEAFRCKAITQRLLEFSRGGERRREPTDLVEVVQSVLDMVQHLQNCKGKRILFEPTGRLVAWVNAQEIKSVVLNLVVNALDSMDDGGALTITLAPRDRQAELVFADTGCGMTAEVLENIFEPFFTRSRTGKGTGLGLSISHRIISQHEGEIEAASRGPGQGSTFTVRVPLQPAENSEPQTLVVEPRSERRLAA